MAKDRTSFESLRLDKVTRTYPRSTAPALTDFDLEIARGEFVALLGPSGCGKSTALACVAGLQPLTSGSIWHGSRRLDTLAPERRGFGMVFQNYALFPHLSVRRNVEFGLAMRKVPRAQRTGRALDMLRLVQLQDHADKLPAQLSGGQQQRVAIARALAIEPEVVLMDEPLSNLDATLRIEMRTEIKRLYQKRGLTVLYVTHDQEEALSLATRIVVLRAGRIEQSGTPEEVYARPASAYVAGFMGYRNLVKASVLACGPEGATIEIAGSRLVGTVVGSDGVRPGDTVVAAVRPEDLVPGATALGSSVDGVVEVIEYHGREQSIEVRTPDGTRLHVRGQQPVAPGSAITLGVAPERLLLFPEAAGASLPVVSPDDEPPASAEDAA